MKKTILTFALMLTAMTAGAKIYQPGDDLNYEYDDENRTATVVQERATYKTDVSGYHIDYYNTYSGDIVIPETAPNGYTVVAIGNGAFQRCNDSRLYELNNITAPTITSITIPKTVKTIGNNAFLFCDQLTSFTIPATVEEIGNSVFYGSSITTMTIEDADTPLIIGNGHLSDRNVFGSASALTTIYAGRDLTPKSTQNTGPFQFAETITDITYGPKVTKLNKHEFWRCKTIKNVKILSTQVTDIPEGAFGECSALEKIELPQSIVTIQNSAFLWCNNLSSVVLPPTVKTIGASAFSGCALTPEFTIPASVEELGRSSFNSTGITALTIEDSDKPLFIRVNSSDYSTVFAGAFKTPCAVYVGRDITCEVEKGPFVFAKNISELTYGPKVTKLNKQEAWRSESIKTVTILSTQVTDIPESAFGECPALETVILPSSINSVADVAFLWDYALNTIYANPVVPPTCGRQVFDGVDKQTCTLFVPLGSLEDYKAAPVWKDFFNIEEMEETKCATPTAVLDGGRVKFSSTTKGVTFHYEYSYPEDGSGEGDEFAVTQTITVSVYATRPGLEDSDVAVYELTIAGGGSSDGDVNGDGAVNVADISAVITIMAKN